jgi:hypothetical protein
MQVGIRAAGRPPRLALGALTLALLSRALAAWL